MSLLRAILHLCRAGERVCADTASPEMPGCVHTCGCSSGARLLVLSLAQSSCSALYLPFPCQGWQAPDSSDLFGFQLGRLSNTPCLSLAPSHSRGVSGGIRHADDRAGSVTCLGSCTQPCDPGRTPQPARSHEGKTGLGKITRDAEPRGTFKVADSISAVAGRRQC